MSLFDSLRYRLRVLLRPDTYGRDLEDEIAHHRELEALANQHRSPGRANDTYLNEERRIVSGIALWDTIRQDVRFVLRILRRRRVFAVATIITLALGIGAATAIFSVADVVLFRPLAFADDGRIVTIWQTRPELRANAVRMVAWDRFGLSLRVVRDWATRQTSFSNVAVWTTSTAIAGGADAADELTIMHASASLLPVLGIALEAGRGFTAAEDAPGGEPVALVSHEAWLTRHGGDRNIIGRRIRIDSVSYTIVGVLPERITLDRRTPPASYWIPAGQSADANDAAANNYWGLGRLASGVSLAAATAETERFAASWPSIGSGTHGVRLTALKDEQTRNVRTPILLLLGASGLLLLIACTNVATVLMGEAAWREHELRTRLALGASRGRLVRQLLTESTVLALISGASGAALAYAGTKIIIRLAPPWIPGLADVHVDPRVLVVALAISLLAGPMLGVVPALLHSTPSASLDLRLGGHSARGRAMSQRALVACEVALSVVLLVAATQLVESFAKVNTIDPGFQRDQLWVMRLRLPQPQYSDTARIRALYVELVDAVGSLPGVTSAAATTTPPFSGGSSSSSYEIEPQPIVREAGGRESQRRVTSPDYFVAAGIRLLTGRTYSSTDGSDAPLVIVVSQSLAFREWPNETAVGKRIKWIGQWRTIIGVVADVKLRSLREDPLPIIYAPMAQLLRGGDPWIIVRARLDDRAAPAALRAVVRRVAPSVPVGSVDRMRAMVSASISDERFRTQLMSFFAAMAALLAAVGMYGVAAAAANGRMREMAIRSAMGATEASIMALILRAGASGVLLGAVVGVGMARAATRLLTPYLFDVSGSDPASYAAVLTLLAITTLAATWIPARRATRVPLLKTLRAE